MKTLISSTGNQLNLPMDKRFGRAKWFCIYDHEKQSTEFIENQYADSQGGAGNQTATFVVELGVQQIISGHFGPKAKAILEQFDIQLIESEATPSIEALIEKLRNN